MSEAVPCVESNQLWEAHYIYICVEAHPNQPCIERSNYVGSYH
jgi:hypothetical protein